MRQKALSKIIEREGLIKTDIVKLYDKRKILGFIQRKTLLIECYFYVAKIDTRKCASNRIYHWE